MQNKLNNLGIRKRGIYMCFKVFHFHNGRYPDNPDDLLTVTSSVINEKNFQKYKEWFLKFIGDGNDK
jgi:hypothetical protein